MIKRLIRRVEGHYRRVFREEYFIKNLNADISDLKQKKVLICYISINSLNNLQRASHTQVGEFSILLGYFLKNNYAIDVFPHDSKCFEEVNENYDVILGFGEIYRYAKKKNDKAIKILYLTENPPEVSKKLEKERLLYFEERYGIRRSFERSEKCFTSEDFENLSAIIYMCEKKYINFCNAYFLAPTGFKRNDYIIDYDEKSNKNFIWLGGTAIIHKGLDIVIEVFRKHPEWQLFVFGVEKEILKKYKIWWTSNIHIMGFVDVNSYDFIKYINKAMFMILPSCSEATPTAALTSMRYGLIPILCRNSGFNEKNQNMIFLEDYHIDYIENEVKKIVDGYTLEKYKIASKDIMNYADEKYSIEKFKQNLNEILNRIL